MNEQQQLIERFPLLAELDLPGQAIINRAEKVQLPANQIFSYRAISAVITSLWWRGR